MMKKYFTGGPFLFNNWCLFTVTAYLVPMKLPACTFALLPMDASRASTR